MARAPSDRVWRRRRPDPPRSGSWLRGEEGRGEAQTGPGFYVWDEDAGYARAWAAELAHVRSAAAAGARG
jgi:hypothetical protein